MNICIVGWYGTETLGDRAILDGILAVFNKLLGEYVCHLGSLNPFFTERTLLEDKMIYEKTSPKAKIKIFDEKSKTELVKAIEDSDYVLMGGGPVMELAELKLIVRAFKIAKKKRKKTILMGCGLGPLHQPEYYEVANELIRISDLVIWRDSLSYELCKKISKRTNDVYVMDDPAIISAQLYKESATIKREDYIAVNLRSFPEEYGKNSGLGMDDIRDLLTKLSEYSQVRMIPMHTFFLGGDDREFFAKICDEQLRKKIQVQYKPQNLYELYETYANAGACVGMRYHAVVLQTILNGNNYILDYTNPTMGKIRGFLSRYELEKTYTKRYFNMQETTQFDREQCVSQLIKNNYHEYTKHNSIDEYCKLIGR